MDLDAYVGAHQGEWRELEQLVSRSSLSAAESDRLLDLYQRVGTHLSVLRSSAPDPALVVSLSSLLARARRRTAGTRTSSLADIGRFFVETLPAALYRLRWWWLISMVVNLAVAFGFGLWFYRNPEIEASMATPAQIAQLVEVDFERYYSEYAASHFAAQVWTNNAWIAAICIGAGVLGVPVVLLLFQNMLNLGLMGSIMLHHDRGHVFFGLLLPHGMLELTAIFVAGGAGLRLFWSWVAPGSRTRVSSMAREGRTTAVIALGLVVVLLISGVIEGFVTPSPLPTWARIAIGLVAWAGFMVYALVLGARAAARGADGDLDAQDRGEDLVAVG